MARSEETDDDDDDTQHHHHYHNHQIKVDMKQLQFTSLTLQIGSVCV